MRVKKNLLITFFCVLIFFSAFRIYKKFFKTISPFKLYSNLIPNTYRIGFTNLDKEVEINNLRVIGKVPKWLNGVLFRNGPAKFTTDKSFVSSWYDGLAMIHSFQIQNGNVQYKNKFLKTRDYDYVNQTGKMDYAGFVQDPCKSIFKRISSYFFPFQNEFSKLPNTNVNIAKLSDHFIALTETPIPVEFDNTSLETIGGLSYDDEFPKSDIQDTAHPHYDFKNNEYLGYFTTFGRNSSHNLFKIKNGSTKREIIYSYKIDKPAYMHTFGITERYAILTLLPLRINFFDLILKNKGFIHNFKWQPELGTEFVVIDRINKNLVGTFKAEPFFAFHIVNSYEDNQNIVMDIVTYPDQSVIEKANFYDLLEPSKFRQAEDIKLKRFIINIQKKNIISKILSDIQLELPRINYDFYNGKTYNFMYAFAQSKNNQEPFYVANQLMKLNVNSGEIKIWQEENCYPGEPVFVQKPKSKIEDDGVILSVVLNSKTQNSFLLILNAKNFKEIARVLVPHHIPFGIHGQFYEQ